MDATSGVPGLPVREVPLTVLQDPVFNAPVQASAMTQITAQQIPVQEELAVTQTWQMVLFVALEDAAQAPVMPLSEILLFMKTAGRVLPA